MATKKVHVVDVIRHGKQIVLPDNMSLEDGAMALLKRQEYEDQETEIIETVDGFIWDGALALQKAIAQMFGWADAKPIEGFFGDTPPKMISVETGVGQSTLVPWGEFTLPGISGKIATSGTLKNGRAIFALQATVKRKHEAAIRELLKLTREFVKKESIYTGKAIKIRFCDDNGQKNALPMPQFIDTTMTKPEEIVFSADVAKSIAGNLYTPIKNKDECRKYGVPLKRGILLSGKYGTGKTLVANATAKICTENGWTFLMCARASEIREMVSFAHQYQPAVIFCEDIDRVVEGERTIEMDDILNVIDGIESKNTDLIVVLTTNHVENINKAMLRPGRLDAVINVLPPDADAVEKLLRMYGRGLVPENANLKPVSEKLAGKIPAIIREAVERAKLYAIASGHFDGQAVVITGENLLDSAISMDNQLALLEGEVKRESLEASLGRTLGEIVTKNVTEVVEAAKE